MIEGLDSFGLLSCVNIGVTIDEKLAKTENFRSHECMRFDFLAAPAVCDMCDTQHLLLSLAYPLFESFAFAKTTIAAAGAAAEASGSGGSSSGGGGSSSGGGSKRLLLLLPPREKMRNYAGVLLRTSACVVASVRGTMH